MYFWSERIFICRTKRLCGVKFRRQFRKIKIFSLFTIMHIVSQSGEKAIVEIQRIFWFKHIVGRHCSNEVANCK